MDMVAGFLNVSNASKAWYLVIVEAFLNSLFKRSIIASTPFSLVISSSSASIKASSVTSSRDNAASEPCLFAPKSVKGLPNLMNLSQSSHVFHFDRDSGILELSDAIVTL